MNSLININHISNYDFHTLASHGIMIQDPTKLFDTTLNDINPFPSKKVRMRLNEEYLTRVFISSDMTKEQYLSTYNLINSDLEEDNTLAEEILKTYE